MKFLFSATALVLSLLLAGTVVADPPPVATCRVFCFRITDIKCDDNVDGRYHFEFEVLNWSDAFAGGIKMFLAPQSSQGVRFGPPFQGGIDANLRPIGPDLGGGIPDNVNRPNSWSLRDWTPTRMEWDFGNPVPFVNLIEASRTDATCANCLGSLPSDPPINIDANGFITPLEAVDNGDNVQGGFVFTIDGLDFDEFVHIDWFLTGADGAETLPFLTPFPDPPCRQGRRNVPVDNFIGTPFNGGNNYGFGLISIWLGENGNVPLPGPQFPALGNTGVQRTQTEFYDDVWDIPPRPNGDNCGAVAMEFAASILANPGAIGDPHFETWSGAKYNFHGQCDLVLLDNAVTTKLGPALTIHIRTKIHDDWSHILKTAIRVGNETLEVEGNTDEFLLNGVTEYFATSGSATIAGYPIEMTFPRPRRRQWLVNFGGGQGIVIQTWKEMVSVTTFGAAKELYGESVGLFGEYATGRRLSRDGTKEIKDWNEFGQEWQVTDKDLQLFSTEASPRYPNKCRMPSPELKEKKRRRLGELEKVTKDAAQKACADVPYDELEFCIFDVLAKNDLDAAGEY